MNYQEAIEHARDVAKKKYAEGMLCHANPNDEELDGCIECARDHEQLAEWLEELQKYKQIGTLEEVREVMERQQAKKAANIRDDKLKFCTCPSCGRRITDVEGGNYCQNCGQGLSRSDKDEQ